MPSPQVGRMRRLAVLGIVGTASLLLLHLAGSSALAAAPILLAVIWLGYRAGAMSRTVDQRNGERQAGQGAVSLPADLIGISALADPAIIVGADWRILAANALASDLFAPRLAGSDLRQAVRHPLVQEAVREAMAGAHATSREVNSLGHAEGVFRVRVVALPEARYLLTFADITQARLTERMRADFVANASHELRTPLANISGFIETLQGPAADDEPARHRFLEIMAREAGRMSRLIDDLLSLSRIELDKYVRPQAPLELPPLLADVGKTLAMRLEADGRRLLIEVADGLPQVVADRDQILQVLHNLVSNALKYGQSGTPIRLRAELLPEGPRQEAMVRVSVEDEGEGIAPEHLPRLTERFYRIDAGRSRSMGGTGLGLAIVKHIVDRHRGRLEISSLQGIGTTVSFTLPVVPLRSDGQGERRQAGPDRHISEAIP